MLRWKVLYYVILQVGVPESDESDEKKWRLQHFRNVEMIQLVQCPFVSGYFDVLKVEIGPVGSMEAFHRRILNIFVSLSIYSVIVKMLRFN